MAAAAAAAADANTEKHRRAEASGQYARQLALLREQAARHEMPPPHELLRAWVAAESAVATARSRNCHLSLAELLAFTLAFSTALCARRTYQQRVRHAEAAANRAQRARAVARATGSPRDRGLERAEARRAAAAAEALDAVARAPFLETYHLEARCGALGPTDCFFVALYAAKQTLDVFEHNYARLTRPVICALDVSLARRGYVASPPSPPPPTTSPPSPPSRGNERIACMMMACASLQLHMLDPTLPLGRTENRPGLHSEGRSGGRSALGPHAEIAADPNGPGGTDTKLLSYMSGLLGRQPHRVDYSPCIEHFKLLLEPPDAATPLSPQ